MNSDKFFTTKQLAERFGLRPSTIYHWRVKGVGPRYIKLVKKILYSIDEVEAWERKNLKRSTA